MGRNRSRSDADEARRCIASHSHATPSSEVELRICAYGWVDREAGSVASAGWQILAALLRCGEEIDLLANPAHVPEPGFASASFRYIGVKPGRTETMKKAIPDPVGRLLEPAFDRAWGRRLRASAIREHGARPYDVLLSLGTIPPFRIGGVRSVVWLQSSPQTELEAIRDLRRQIVNSHGRAFFAALVVHYRLSLLRERKRLKGFDALIVGSEWSRSKLMALGLPPEITHALPYPIDVAGFSGEPLDALPDTPILLHLGRLDPRKRIDLLLDAFPVVRAQYPSARVEVVGRAGYGRGFEERIAGVCGARYQAHVGRDDVSAILRKASLLVQPSMNENFGSSVAEALAAGRPVVVGPTNGTADYIPTSSAQFSEYSPDSVAAAIVQVLRNLEADRTSVARESRCAAERAFSPDVVAARLVDILRGRQRE